MGRMFGSIRFLSAVSTSDVEEKLEEGKESVGDVSFDDQNMTTSVTAGSNTLKISTVT